MPRLKTLVVLTLAIAANGAGNVCLSAGMRAVGPPAQWTFSGLQAVVATALATPAVLAGAGLLVVFFALFLSLLSWEDLSFVLPMVSLCFVVSAFLGHILLAEPISVTRAVGIALIAVGASVVGRSSPRTAPPGPAPHQ